MSKYASYSLKTMRNQEVLLAALAACGYSAGKVEVHATPQALYGIGGQARRETATIIIRRHNTGIGASNDIGFLRTAAGTYTAIVSEYDSRALMGGQFLSRVQAAYAKINGDRAIKTVLTTTIPRLKQQGKIPPNATVSRQVVGQTTKILVSY